MALIIATYAAVSVSCQKEMEAHLILIWGPMNSSYAAHYT